MPATPRSSSSSEFTRQVERAPIPAGGFSTIGKPTSEAKPRASVSPRSNRLRATGNPASRNAAFIFALSRNSSATAGGVPGTPKCARACASWTIIASRMPMIRSGCPCRFRRISVASMMSCVASGSVTLTKS